MTILGQLALGLALLLAAWGVVTGFLGGARGRPELVLSARRAVYALAGALTIASAALVTALVRHDFNVEYVASYTSRNLPLSYTIAAFYGGQAGSLLFWALVLSLFAAAAQWLTPRRYDYLLPYVAATTSAVALFFIIVTMFGANPFTRLPFTPMDGRGLNPQLQNPGMVVHPPMLYLGYISITIPFSFAVAALLSKRLDVGWLHAIRKWTILSWLFLSIGITLGMWWAYVELGWGGYWAWDPVENASFLPWLTMTAFLHSVMIQEKRGMLKRWNMLLIFLSFLLSIFGTFVTRSGIISSVHSFAQSSVGYYFLGFLILGGVGAGWLLWSRFSLLQTEGRLESTLSRESTFLFNNLLLVGMAFSVLWGTTFPILSELVQGTKVTVGTALLQSGQYPHRARAPGVDGDRPARCVAAGERRQSPAAFRGAGERVSLQWAASWWSSVSATSTPEWRSRLDRSSWRRCSRSSSEVRALGTACTVKDMPSPLRAWLLETGGGMEATSSISGSSHTWWRSPGWRSKRRSRPRSSRVRRPRWNRHLGTGIR